MRILLADDRDKVRGALQLLFEQEPGLVVAGEAENSGNLLLLAVEQQPDVIMLDWELPGQPLDMILPLLRRLLPNAKVIAMSVRPEAEHAAFEAGVDGFVSKNVNAEGLLAALHAFRPRSLPLN